MIMRLTEKQQVTNAPILVWWWEYDACGVYDRRENVSYPALKPFRNSRTLIISVTILPPI